MRHGARGRSRESERGHVAVFVGLVAFVLLGFAALGTDLGQLFLARVRLQDVADFAALAGARHLPDDPGTARQEAYAYLERNGVDPHHAGVTVSAGGRELEVRIARQDRLHFAPVLGFRSATVGALARARVDPITSAYGAVPLGVPEGNYTLGQPVLLKASPHTGGPISPGNFQALALGGRGASRYEHNLTYGYPGKIRVGDWIETEPGNMAGPTDRAVESRLLSDPDATWDHFARGSGRVLLVPVVSGFPNGRGEVQVRAFAVFFLEDRTVCGAGPQDKGAVCGRFIRYTWPGEMDPGGTDYGAVGVKLVR